MMGVNAVPPICPSDVSDIELLRNYHRHGSEDAFAELVRRHINLVYSAALRHVGIAAQAEEIVSPPTGNARFGTQAWSAYRKLMKNYVGVNGEPSSRDKLFACPADAFYLSITKTGPFLYHLSKEPASLYEQSPFDYSSYGFNGGTATKSFAFQATPGIGHRKT